MTLGLRFDLSSYTRTNTFRYHAIHLRTEADEDIALVTVPGEALHAVGERIKADAAARGADQTFFLGLANGALSYIAGPEEYYRGGYEAMATVFGPETGPRSEEAVASCLEAVGFQLPPKKVGH